MTTKQKYRQLLHDHFPVLWPAKPLYYNWNNGLRFNLQVGKFGTDAYFEQVTERAACLFEAAFDSSESLFLVFRDYKYKRRKIRLSNFVFKQVENLEKSEIAYSKERGLYDPNDKTDRRNLAVIELTPQRLNYRALLTAIAHKDFLPRQPRLDNWGMFSDKEIYFVNINRKIIMHMYDDRGLDLIAADKEMLRPIYDRYNDWLLDYDRKQMDELFGR